MDFPLVSCSSIRVCKVSIRVEYAIISSPSSCLLEYSSKCKCVVVLWGTNDVLRVSFSSIHEFIERNLTAARVFPVNLIRMPYNNSCCAFSFAHLIANSHCSKESSRSSWFTSLNVVDNNLSTASNSIVLTNLSDCVEGSGKRVYNRLRLIRNCSVHYWCVRLLFICWR